MKTKLITRLSSIALTACLAIGVSSAGAQMYDLTDLGILPGKKENVSTAAAINDSGQVAGTSDGSAFRYTKDGKIPMEDVGQNPYGLSRGFGIDGSGQVVGDSTFGKDESVSHAAIFSNGSATDLGTIKGGGLFSRANGINASGQVVGFSSETRDGDTSRAFIVTPSKRSSSMVDLGTLGGAYAQAWGINDSGFVTGNSQTADRSEAIHAFLWHGRIGMLDLGTLAGDFSYGTFINVNNHVVGYSTIDKYNDRVHAFLHDGKEMIDLGSLGGASSESDRSFALGVNASDEVVGYSYLPSKWDGNIRPPQQQVAFVYSKGVMVNLNDLIGDSVKEYRLDSATAINDNGQIVAIAFVNSEAAFHAVLLTPMRETPMAKIAPTIEITVATFAARTALLTVQATCTAGAPGTRPLILKVYAGGTGELIGTLNAIGKNRYFGSFTVKSNPEKIWVESNNGGRAYADVQEIK